MSSKKSNSEKRNNLGVNSPLTPTTQLDLCTIDTQEALTRVLTHTEDAKDQIRLLRMIGRHPRHKNPERLIQKIIEIGTVRLHREEKTHRLKWYLSTLLIEGLTDRKLVLKIAEQYNIDKEELLHMAKEKKSDSVSVEIIGVLVLNRAKATTIPTPTDQRIIGETHYPPISFHNLRKGGHYREAIAFLRGAQYAYTREDQIRCIEKLVKNVVERRCPKIIYSAIDEYLKSLIGTTTSLALLSEIILVVFKASRNVNERYIQLTNTRLIYLLQNCTKEEKSVALDTLYKQLLVRATISGYNRLIVIYFALYKERGGTISAQELKSYATSKQKSFYGQNETQQAMVKELIECYENGNTHMQDYVRRHNMKTIKEAYDLFVIQPGDQRTIGKNVSRKDLFNTLNEYLKVDHKDSADYAIFFFRGVQKFHNENLEMYMKALRLLEKNKPDFFRSWYDKTIYPTLQELAQHLPPKSQVFTRTNGSIFRDIAEGKKLPVNKIAALVTASSQPE